MNLPLSISKPCKLIFGHAPKPVTCRSGLLIGGGEVYPEINFTLPTMIIEESSWGQVETEYRQMIEGIAQRAVELEAPGLVVEFELLPPMTFRPEWGAELTRILSDSLAGFARDHGLRSALRVTPTDIRDNDRPPQMRTGEHAQTVLRSFDLCAAAGGELLSIESTGGKELHDAALMNGNLAGILYALGVLAPRDMEWLWTRIADIARRHKAVAAGDTACGFANTAMVLADRKVIPRVLAAVVRVAATVRSWVALRAGAVGPSKDCAYEGPFLKAMTGVPISMEGKTSACAHLSVVGNIAGACCDLWSNESVQNVRLLSAPAPVVSVEQLIYDCRLMNQAASEGPQAALDLQRWMVESDAARDPQAYVLHPEVVVRLAGEMASESDPLAMTFRAVEKTLEVLREAQERKRIVLPATELKWMDLLEMQLESLPRDEAGLWEQVRMELPQVHLLREEYGL